MPVAARLTQVTMDEIRRAHLRSLGVDLFDIDEYDGPLAEAMFVISYDDVFAFEFRQLLAESAVVLERVAGVDHVLWADRERFIVFGGVDRDALRRALSVYWAERYLELLRSL